MNFAAESIRHCQQNHVKCAKPSLEEWKPTRLIDIGPLDEPIQPRLILTESISDPISYASLSHHWGSADMSQLKKGNMNALQKSIPQEKLPKTFLDAFEVCKKLGMRYIWID